MFILKIYQVNLFVKLSALCYRVAFFSEYLKLDEGEVIVDIDDWNKAYENFAHDLYEVIA